MSPFGRNNRSVLHLGRNRWNPVHGVIVVQLAEDSVRRLEALASLKFSGAVGKNSHPARRLTRNRAGYLNLLEVCTPNRCRKGRDPGTYYGCEDDF